MSKWGGICVKCGKPWSEYWAVDTDLCDKCEAEEYKSKKVVVK